MKSFSFSAIQFRNHYLSIQTLCQIVKRKEKKMKRNLPSSKCKNRKRKKYKFSVTHINRGFPPFSSNNSSKKINKSKKNCKQKFTSTIDSLLEIKPQQFNLKKTQRIATTSTQKKNINREIDRNQIHRKK